MCWVDAFLYGGEGACVCVGVSVCLSYGVLITLYMTHFES